MLRNRGIQLDLPESFLILDDILLQDRYQRLGLLWAQINALEVVDLNVSRGLRLQAAKNQKKIPHAGPYLHGVSVTFAIFRGINQTNIRLRRISHEMIPLFNVSLRVGEAADFRKPAKNRMVHGTPGQAGQVARDRVIGKSESMSWPILSCQSSIRNRQ